MVEHVPVPLIEFTQLTAVLHLWNNSARRLFGTQPSNAKRFQDFAQI